MKREKPNTPPAKKQVKRAAAKAEPPKPAAPEKRKKSRRALPPLLLEGDQPPPPAASGPGHRYALGPVPPGEHFTMLEDLGELPEAYGTKRLLLTARDPHWLYAHWDLTREQLSSYNRLSRDGHLVVRVCAGALGTEPVTQVHVHPESLHWFIHVGRGGTRYLAELGYYDPSGAWTTISASTSTLTPVDTPSEDASAHFETIPAGIPFEQLLGIVKSVATEQKPLAEALGELRAAGHPGLPEPHLIAANTWTAAHDRALAAVVSLDPVRRVWVGSLEVTELVRRHLQEQVSSAEFVSAMRPEAAPAAAAAAPGLGMLAAPLPGISSPSARPGARRGFWFAINAELIVYCATEPDAKVSIGGHPIKLRSDGSFSYRFAFPDGRYELPAIAVSVSGDDARLAALQFGRATEYSGDVAALPQAPGLRTPAAAPDAQI